MDKTRTYVETTIPSFYFEARTTPEIIARRDWTRRWWDGAAQQHELVTSEAVLDELAEGPSEQSVDWIRLIQDLPLLTIDSAVVEIVEAYVRHRVMPADPGGDALHLALASFHSAISWSPGTVDI